jgi:hypothetical protein
MSIYTFLYCDAIGSLEQGKYIRRILDSQSNYSKIKIKLVNFGTTTAKRFE